jgi:thiaminase (transcriptional activator TenA)
MVSGMFKKRSWPSFPSWNRVSGRNCCLILRTRCRRYHRNTGRRVTPGRIGSVRLTQTGSRTNSALLDQVGQPMLHDQLWQLNREVAESCLEHPFVQALGHGTLDPELFQRYVAQDAFFLRAYLRAYALAAARCPEVEDVQVFHELMAGALKELQVHAGCAARSGIDLVHVEPYSVTRAYTDFVLRVAWQGRLGEAVAAMVPCMRLYAYLGEQLATYLCPEHPYAEWIQTYSGEAFQKLATQFESLLDRVAVDSPEVRDAYRYAMQCELDFFSAPLED